VGEGALKIGRRWQQSRRFFVTVGVVETEIFLSLDGSVEAGSLPRVQKVAVGKLGKFKLKYQGKHVILLCLNLYSQC
jgi:hypothetical protein